MNAQTDAHTDGHVDKKFRHPNQNKDGAQGTVARVFTKLSALLFLRLMNRQAQCLKCTDPKKPCNDWPT
jgi:hypothetical protein